MIVCPRCDMQYDADTRFCGRCGSEMAAQVAAAVAEAAPGVDPVLGQIVDTRYRVIDRLGQGGMGSVYRVEHLAMGKHAAMKLLHPLLAQDPEAVLRFRREAEAVSKLSHANTVQVYDFGRSPHGLYLVMELVRGEDLGAVLRREGPLPVARVLAIVIQICEALSEAHELGIVHRDLKPENLLVHRARDGRDLVKVVDFGLAKLRTERESSQVTQRGALLGTPYYMSPEQIRAEELDPRSDVYSLGAVMYRLITGEVPFSAPSPVAVLTAALTAPLVPPSERRRDLVIAPEVDAVVLRAMARDKDERYGSADELRMVLGEHLGSASGMSLSAGAAPRPSGSREAGHSPAGKSQLRREDIDAYERSLRRRRLARIVGLPALLACVLLAAGVVVHRRASVGLTEEREPNNTAAQANLISSHRTLRGHMGQRLGPDQSDRDIYQINVRPGPHVMRVELTGIPKADLKLTILDSNGRRIAATDSGGPGDGEVIPNARVDGGAYYIVVREVWVRGQPALEDDQDWYTLNATLHRLGPNEESEPDDTAAAALPLELGAPERGYLGQAGDIDFYRLTGTAGGTLSGQVSGIQGVDLRLVVLPPGTAPDAKGELPPQARIFDSGGPGEPEAFSGVPWPAGSAAPLLIVERKDRHAEVEPHGSVVGVDVPYALTVRQAR